MTQGTGTPLRPAREGADIGTYELAPGLYEAPITRTLRRKLDLLHDSGGRPEDCQIGSQLEHLTAPQPKRITVGCPARTCSR